MKKILFFFAAAAFVLSCTREASEPEISVPSDGMVEITLNASTESGTKNEISGKHVLWSAGDEIALFCNGQNYKFTSQNTEPVASADFTGMVSQAHADAIAAGASDAPVWAVYPYKYAEDCDGESVTLYVPSMQKARHDNWADYSFPSIARTYGTDLRFFNVCGGLKLHFSRNDIECVSIVSNNGEPLAGTVKVAFDGNNRPYIKEVVDGVDCIDLLAPDYGFSEYCDYFVPILPGTLSSGLTIYFDTGQTCVVGVKTSAKSSTFKRGVFGSVSGVDENLAWELYIDNPPATVDLGLSVDWAVCNLGAEEPSDYGCYFAWGETAPKENFDWSTYKWCNGSDSSLTKYQAAGSSLDADDDVAAYALGGDWRMPTSAEIQELIDGCTWAFQYQGGVNVLVGTSKSDTSKSIVFPLSGWRSGVYLNATGNYNGRASFWASDLMPEVSSLAMNFLCNYSGAVSPSVYRLDRCYGLPVRPVLAVQKEVQKDVKFSEHNMAYWFNDVESSYNTVRCFARVPLKYIPNQPDNDDVKVFSKNLLDNWVQYKIDIKVDGTLVTDGSVKYKFVFSEDQPVIAGKKWSVSSDRGTLNYDGQPVVTITEEGVVTYIWDEDPDYISKVLLNKWKPDATDPSQMLYCNVDLVAYSEVSGSQVELGHELMHVRFMRPVTFYLGAGLFFYDGMPAGDGIPLGDFFTACACFRPSDDDGFLLFRQDSGGVYRSCYYPDENNVSTAYVYWYDYFGFRSMSFDIDRIKTNQNGAWALLKNANPYINIFVAPASDHTNMSYDPACVYINNISALTNMELVFKNNGPMLSSCNLRIPISVTYSWGTWTGEVLVAVNP